MRAYKNIKFQEFPDVADIQCEARKSSVGRYDERGYHKNKNSKAATRRYLKRRDKSLENKFQKNCECE